MNFMMRSFLFALLLIGSVPFNCLRAQEATPPPAAVQNQSAGQKDPESKKEEAPAALSGFPDLDAERRALGLSEGAAKVYAKEHGFTFGGYGEVLYEKFSHDTTTNSDTLPIFEGLATGKDQELGLVRGVVFLGYRVSDRVVLNSEWRLDRDLVERGVATFPSFYDTLEGKTVGAVDLAYMDYILSPALTLRAGVVLLPMGLINEFHQPNEYLGTRSGFGDLFVIPSIWHALGFGVAGHKWVFDYRAYVVSGLNAAGFTEFGLRGGREVTWDTISHPALVFRVDYNPFPGGVLGVSYYVGNSGIFGLDQSYDLKIHTTIKELHGELRWKGAFARAQYAKALLHSTPELNQILETTGYNGVGKRQVGGYVEGGWNILWARKNGTMIMPYMRGEASNPQDALPPPSLDLGLIKNHYLDFIIWKSGVEWRPVRPLSIKIEYQSIHDQNQIFWKEFHLDTSYVF